MTPREVDARIAEALGWNIVRINPFHRGERLMIEDPDMPTRKLFDCPPYWTEPTGETMLQLIEGMAATHGPVAIPGYGDGWHLEIEYPSQLGLGPPARAKFWRYINLPNFGPVPQGVWAEGETLPKAVAEAARVALGIEAPE